MNDKDYFVYILASRRNGALYIGMTSDLSGRVWEHKNNVVSSHTEKYNIHNLVYFETFGDVRDAIDRERKLKKWRREWKIALIEKDNSDWRDLYEETIW